MAKDNWNYFDAWCMVGRHVRLTEGAPHTADDLLAEMNQYGIAESLVLDCLSRESHPLDGNCRVLQVTQGRPRLHPAWAALPPGTDEQPAPQKLLSEMRRHRVGALMLFPDQYRFTLSPWCVDELLEPLAAAGVPVFIRPGELGPAAYEPQDGTDWDAVVALCRRMPALPVIVSEMRIRRSQRLAYRALDACENLRIELSGYWLHHGIEYVTERWGSRRLVFGSNWPKFGPHMTLATLAMADIAPEDKRSIAGDNLRELIAWCKPKHPQVTPKPPADEFVAFGRTGRRPKKMTFGDCHGHLGGRGAHYHVPDGDLDTVVREMDRLGVERTCVFSFVGVTSDEVFGNDIVIDAVRRYPDRFVGFTLLNPHRGREAMLRELERCAQRGLCGIKLIPHYQGYPEEGPLLEVACQWAHERRQIILNHSWASAAHLGQLIERYPGACYFTGHATTAYAELMKRRANLYVCSCPLLGPRACEEMVATIGADRLLFGSDLLDLPMAWGLGPILLARIPVAEKRMILGGTLRRILESYSVHP